MFCFLAVFPTNTKSEGHIHGDRYNDVIEKLVDTIFKDTWNDVIEKCDDADNDTPNSLKVIPWSFLS